MARTDTVYGPPRMWLTVLRDGRPLTTVEIEGPEVTVGRDEGCGLVLDDPKVSRTHATITPGVGATRVLRDLGSANGTLVNGQPIKPTVGFTSSGERVAELAGGEVLQFGDSIVVATLGDPRNQDAGADAPG